ncbi:hypothetical protein OUZ56_027220 [Daphnia magna]|uniref:Uncharacterized protein n=1 Tax=Daphnia magna TaxID=35525 RepID=A0ABQ9ZPU8_9CRUS|nr:hypothetical protein OUZ56_027220 [Daphnia magna]
MAGGHCPWHYLKLRSHSKTRTVKLSRIQTFVCHLMHTCNSRNSRLNGGPVMSTCSLAYQKVVRHLKPYNSVAFSAGCTLRSGLW